MREALAVFYTVVTACDLLLVGHFADAPKGKRMPEAVVLFAAFGIFMGIAAALSWAAVLGG